MLLVRTFRAMGTTAELQAPPGHEAMLDRWQRQVLSLEALASRFLPDSALSRHNRGVLAALPEPLARIVAVAEAFRRETGGLFDHRLLEALLDAGYSRSLDPAAPSGQPPAWQGIDLGGIAKGWLADQLVAEADGAGIPALVNLGGDLRVSLEPPPGQAAWLVGVEDPFRPGTDLGVLLVTGQGVATSSVRRRRWLRAGAEVHHVIDPRTGRPATTDLVAVTAVAGSAAQAEAWAKAALILGQEAGASRLEGAGLGGVLVGREGVVTATREIRLLPAG